MPNPTRDTTAGRVYNDLRNLARRSARSTDEVMVERRRAPPRRRVPVWSPDRDLNTRR